MVLLLISILQLRHGEGKNLSGVTKEKPELGLEFIQLGSGLVLLNILSFNVLEEKSRVKDCIEVSFTQIEICYMKG